jgi:hypothetical protein
MKNLITYEDFLNEAKAGDRSSGNIFNPKRNKAVQFDHTKHPELAGEFFNLISIAYASIGGHVKIQSPKDVFSDPDWNWWEGVDLHGTKDFDLLMFGSKTKFGVKFAGVGHDGSSQAKRKYIEARAEDLVKPGYYIEVSGKIAEILINDYKCPIVDNEKDVEKVLGKDVEWTGKCSENPNAPGNGWYDRKLGGHMHAKIMLGRPRV